LLGIDDPGHCDALSSAHTVSDTPPGPGLQAYRAILGHKWLNEANKPVTSKTLG